jgi:hypothetical protein
LSGKENLEFEQDTLGAIFTIAPSVHFVAEAALLALTVSTDDFATGR